MERLREYVDGLRITGVSTNTALAARNSCDHDSGDVSRDDRKSEMMENTPTEAPQPVWRFLAGLQQMDLRIWSEEERLRVSAPRGVLTPRLRGELSARKAEVLDFLRETRAVNGHAAPPVRPVPRSQPLPLSFAQQRLWMVEQMSPGRSGYDVGWRLRLEGDLSIPALRSAIVELVGRHEALRTSPLSALSIQQADFAVWQRKYLDPASTTYEAHLAFWLKELSGNPLLKLPCEPPRPLKMASINRCAHDGPLPAGLLLLQSLTARSSSYDDRASISADDGFETIMEKAQAEAPQPVWRFLAGLQRMVLQIWSEERRFLRETHVANDHASASLRSIPRDTGLISCSWRQLLYRK